MRGMYQDVLKNIYCCLLKIQFRPVRSLISIYPPEIGGFGEGRVRTLVPNVRGPSLPRPRTFILIIIIWL